MSRDVKILLASKQTPCNECSDQYTASWHMDVGAYEPEVNFESDMRKNIEVEPMHIQRSVGSSGVNLYLTC